MDVENGKLRSGSGKNVPFGSKTGKRKPGQGAAKAVGSTRREAWHSEDSDLRVRKRCLSVGGRCGLWTQGFGFGEAGSISSNKFSYWTSLSLALRCPRNPQQDGEITGGKVVLETDWLLWMVLLFS